MSILNEVEREMEVVRGKQRPEGSDIHVWKRRNGFKRQFSTQETWRLIRDEKPMCTWETWVVLTSHSKFFFHHLVSNARSSIHHGMSGTLESRS